MFANGTEMWRTAGSVSFRDVVGDNNAFIQLTQINFATILCFLYCYIALIILFLIGQFGR